MEAIEWARLAATVSERQVSEARALLSTLQHEQQRVTGLVARQISVVQNLQRAADAGREVAAEVGHLGALDGLEQIVGDHEAAAPATEEPQAATAPEAIEQAVVTEEVTENDQ